MSCVLLLVPRLPVSCHPAAVKQISVPPGYCERGPHLVPGVSSWRGWEGAGHGVWAAAGEALATGALGRVADVLWSLFTCSAVNVPVMPRCSSVWGMYMAGSSSVFCRLSFKLMYGCREHGAGLSRVVCGVIVTQMHLASVSSCAKVQVCY